MQRLNGGFLTRLRIELQDGPRVARQQHLHGRLGHEPSAIEDGDPIADALDVIEDMGAHEDRGGARAGPR